ncbi:NAD(P)/FAD-dependent oxidoreductase [uncultured Algimonas sp.]|uniref:NAD(P)/FAD-dependent oxidoreductase n=1 Tax=uncultured Algimonas sp. TaxID=1547920 RepID=UPI00260B73EE|nr:NAD(P)/FAD-dependent oxidoreductase [uncultured Algimonas sp.]
MNDVSRYDFDVVIVGAGAAGLMAAIVAGRRDRRVLLIDHAERPGEKIRISGGGRCNFTHLFSSHENFISANPHFHKSALSRYTPHDFLELVERHGIAWEEKAKGQLFCQGKSTQIVDMLVAECREAGVELRLGTDVLGVSKPGPGFAVTTPTQTVSCESLVIATGGPSIPKMGASRFGYRVAEQFGLDIVETVPALVPLTFTDEAAAPLKALSGVAVDAAVVNERIRFDEPLLFTHRGLSGPAVLQISSYWEPGEAFIVDLAPGTDVLATLKQDREARPRLSPSAWLSERLPARLAEHLSAGLRYDRLADMPDTALLNLALQVSEWRVKPAGSEGYRKAEVTRGGISTDELSSKTMETKSVPGLYFIGEVVDVTGHLGGHNFQWAWASGVACGEVC